MRVILKMSVAAAVFRGVANNLPTVHELQDEAANTAANTLKH